MIMDILELMKSRHSVRQYRNQPIEEDKRALINVLITEINAKGGPNMQVFYDEPECFGSFMAHYGKFSGVSNYVVITGTKKDREKAGYYGEKLVLRCQELGLNTCWVALTHGKTKAVIEKGKKILIVIALGYGENHGAAHKSKVLHALGSSDVNTDWFETGLMAASLAPTAMNQQKFFFELKNGRVSARAFRGFYSKIDLGIVKYHFEAATGHEVL